MNGGGRDQLLTEASASSRIVERPVDRRLVVRERNEVVGAALEEQPALGACDRDPARRAARRGTRGSTSRGAPPRARTSARVVRPAPRARPAAAAPIRVRCAGTRGLDHHAERRAGGRERDRSRWRGWRRSRSARPAPSRRPARRRRRAGNPLAIALPSTTRSGRMPNRSHPPPTARRQTVLISSAMRSAPDRERLLPEHREPLGIGRREDHRLEHDRGEAVARGADPLARPVGVVERHLAVQGARGRPAHPRPPPVWHQSSHPW